jgi:hypothetical protein
MSEDRCCIASVTPTGSVTVMTQAVFPDPISELALLGSSSCHQQLVLASGGCS